MNIPITNEIVLRDQFRLLAMDSTKKSITFRPSSYFPWREYMSTLEWDGSLALGHEKIDAQHKSLVELVNNLHIACIAGGGHCDLRPTLMALYKYTLFHFNEEEALMKSAGYAFRDEHILEHSAFINKLDELADKVKAGEFSIGTETFTWLVGWLLDHISVTDQKLATCLAGGHLK